VVEDGFPATMSRFAAGESRQEDDHMVDEPSILPPNDSADARKPLTPAARRALAEAEARRAASQAAAGPKENPKEIQGPKGPEPTRFGDWERNGIASDF
jgi:hypothetical protein